MRANENALPVSCHRERGITEFSSYNGYGELYEEARVDPLGADRRQMRASALRSLNLVTRWRRAAYLLPMLSVYFIVCLATPYHSLMSRCYVCHCTATHSPVVADGDLALFW